MKFLKTFESYNHIKTFENIDKGWQNDRFINKKTKSGVRYSIPVYTTLELETKKAKMLEEFKKDSELQHLSEEGMITAVDVFFKLEIKYGNIIISDL